MSRALRFLPLIAFFIGGLTLFSRTNPAAGRTPAEGIQYLYVVPISHLDIGFNYSVPEVMALQKQYLDEAMAYAEQYPDYHWTIESVWQLDQWLAQTADPAEVDRLRGLIDQGQISVTAGYANMHQGSMGSEEFTRFVYPARAYEEAWGLDLETAISDDVPGSSSALPQVLSAAGIHNLVAGINTTFGGEPDIPVSDTLFTWQGMDGSQVLTWVSFKSYAEGIFDYWLTSNYSNMKQHTQAMIDFYEANGYPYDAIIVMLGFDNDAPDTLVNALDNIAQWNQEHPTTQIVAAGPNAFFQHVRAVYGDDAFTTYSGDWSGRWENLNTNTPISTAQNRSTKEAVAQAETLLAAAFALDKSRPYPAAAFDQVYRDLLVFEEHSGAGGGFNLTTTQINDSLQWFRQSVVSSTNTAGQWLNRGLRALTNNIATDEPALVVFNGLSWPRSDLVTVPVTLLNNLTGPGWRGGWQLVDLATGEVVTIQATADGRDFIFLAEDVPSLGYRLYGIRPAADTPQLLLTAGVNEIENDFYRVAVSAVTGEIDSIYDKVNGREVVFGDGNVGFNRLVKADQAEATIWGLWHDLPAGPMQVTAEIGPVQSRLIIKRAQSPLRQTVITLPAALPRIELFNELDHDRTEFTPHETHTTWYYVTMPFDLGASGFTGRFQGPGSWLMPPGDWLAGTAHNARVSRHGTDVRDAAGYGVTVANRESYLASFGSTGFWDATEAEAPLLFLNLFARSDEAYTTDQGWVAFDSWEPGAPRLYPFNFALTATAGGFDPVAASQFSGGFNAPLLAAGIARRPDGPLPGPTGSLMTVSQASVVVSAFKRADFENPDGTDLILRLQEIGGQPATAVTVTLPFALAWAETNTLTEGRAGAVPLPVNPLQIDLTPYQTVTIRLRPLGN